jgi:heme/copper-type cytochrome/quinol oxidase subunit 2
MLLVVAASAFVFTISLPALAEGPDVWGETTGNEAGSAVVSDATGLGVKDPRAIAAQIINIILGFLGIVAVVIILLGGFKWMTAGGNEDKVGEAKKLIVAGVIGLVIILASFGIATFVLTQLGAAVAG